MRRTALILAALLSTTTLVGCGTGTTERATTGGALGAAAGLGAVALTDADALGPA